MKTSVLEFKLFDELFCLNTQYIDYVFELEDFNKIDAFHESVVGITKYNQDVMTLIDTATLFSNKKLDFTTAKSVIVIKDSKNGHYGLAVDEIIKIEDVEMAINGIKLSTKETTINHYKAKDVIINEIDPIPLLEKYNIPAMKRSKNIQSKVSNDINIDNFTDFLLFNISKNHYGIESKYVKEVVENSSKIFPLNDDNHKIKGAMAIREEIIKIANLDTPENSEDIIIVEIDKNTFGIEADNIKDIESFMNHKLEYINDKKHHIKAFYNYRGNVIAIIDPLFYINQDIKREKKSQNNTIAINQSINRLSYLIFKIEDKKYAINMQHLRRVVQTDTLPKTKSSSNIVGQNTKFITTWNKQAINIITLDKILKNSSKDDDETQAIFVEIDKKIVAFIVDEIDDIVTIDLKDINISKDDKQNIINGALIYNKNLIPTINEKKLLEIG